MGDLYIGLMSGTSMDGIDAVLMDLSANPRILATRYTPYDKDVRDPELDRTPPVPSAA